MTKATTSSEDAESGNHADHNEMTLGGTVSFDDLQYAKSQSLIALAIDCDTLISIASLCDRHSRGSMTQTARSTVQTLERVKRFSQQLEGTNESGVLQAAAYFDMFGSELGSAIVSFLRPDSPASTFTRDRQDLQRSFLGLLRVSGNFLAVQVGVDALDSVLAFPPDLRLGASVYLEAAAQRRGEWAQVQSDLGA